MSLNEALARYEPERSDESGYFIRPKLCCRAAVVHKGERPAEPFIFYGSGSR